MPTCTLLAMGKVFIGSEAVAAGALSGYQLRSRHRAVFPDVYVPRGVDPSLNDRILAAWLWSHRKAVIAGVAASALHGARWVDAAATIELVAPSARRHSGLLVRNDTLDDDEVTTARRLPVTSVARTAFDLGRHLPRGQALARLDALMHATPFSFEDVAVLAKRHRGARGLRRLAEVLPLVDGGSASPKETWLRLLLIDAGLPRPATQIPVDLGRLGRAYLDMGWEEYMVAAEYDGDQHFRDRWQYVKDIGRLARFAELGWIVVRVVAEHRPDEIVARVRRALVSRGYPRD